MGHEGVRSQATSSALRKSIRGGASGVFALDMARGKRARGNSKISSRLAA
jgi:hypothetical protein